MNYNSLELDLQTYMLRTDQPYIDKIPDIIEQGIIRVYNNAKDIGFEIQLDPINIGNGEYQIAKPGGWRETISFILVQDTISYLLFPRTYEYCKTYSPDRNIIARPKYYSDVPINNNNNAYGYWEITPTSDDNYIALIIYLGLPLFNKSNPTNFLTQRYPNLLLYSCLMEASLFLDNEEKRNKYEMMFSKELETINLMNQNRTTDRTIVREKS